MFYIFIIIYRDVHTFSTNFTVLRILGIGIEQFLFQRCPKNKNRKLFILICPTLSPEFGFPIFFSNTEGIIECENFSPRILTTLRVFGKYRKSV
jgi:hypothetical protein